MGFGSALGSASAKAAGFAIDKAKGAKSTVASYKSAISDKAVVSSSFEFSAEYRDAFGTPSQSAPRALRYTVGLRPGKDTVATLINTDTPELSYTSFSVLDLSVDDQELINILPAQDNSFFVESSGRASRTLRINGVLLNADKFEWFKDWMSNYDKVFRSSRMIRRRAITALTLDGVAYHGLIFNFTVSKNSEQENAPMFGFSFLVMDIKVIDVLHTGYANKTDTNYFTDFSTNFFGLNMDGKSPELDANGKPFAAEVIGYRRKETKPGSSLLLALGAAAVSMADPAKWAALQGADKSQAAAQMVGKSSSMFGQTAGSAGGVIGGALAAGMGGAVAMAIAKKETKGSFGAKMAEAGLDAAESFVKDMMGGTILFGVGEKFAPGQAYDNSKFSSGWRGLVSKVVEFGFSAARMGISRGTKGGMSSVNFGVTTAYNSPSRDIGFTYADQIAGANVLHTNTSFTMSNSVPKGISADVKVTDISINAARSGTDKKTGPMFDFTPSQSNETFTDPVSMTTVLTPSGARPASGGIPTEWGPIYDI